MAQKYCQQLGTIIPVLAGLVVMPQTGHATDEQGMAQRYTPPKIEGMRHIKIDDGNKGDKDKKTDNSQEPGKSNAQQTLAPQKPKDGGSDNDDQKEMEKTTQGKPESHFRKKKGWQRFDVIPSLASDNLDKVNRALADIAAEPHKTTPYGLMLAARGHIKHEQMRRAALYYYAARLRTNFDSLRFPASNPSALKHERYFSQLARQLSTPVYNWVFAKPERFDDVMTSLREWEHDTAYAYKPLYPTPKARPHKEWPKLHKKARDQTLAQMKKRAEAYRQQQQ